MSITNKWYLRNGRLFCVHCKEPSSSKTHGQGHSYCFAEPSPGRGYPLASDPPLRLVTGFTSHLNGHMTRYLMQPSEQKAADDLERRHPGWAKVYWEHRRGGETLEQIAQRLGISTAAAWQRNSRARKFIAERIRLYEDELDERRRVDGPPTEADAAEFIGEALDAC